MNAPGGRITLTEAAHLDVSGNDSSNQKSGSVVIRGGRLLVDNASIAAITSADGAEVGTDIDVTEAVFKGGSSIRTNTVGQGSAGSIRVRAHQVTVEAGATISSNTISGGDAGTVEVTATDKIAISGNLSSSTANAGKAGTVRLIAPFVRLEEGGVLQATSTGRGPAGSIIVRAEDGDVVLMGGRITSSTTDSEDGGGNIKLTARTVTLTEGAVISANSVGRGDAGTIRLQAEEIVLSGSSTAVTTATFGSDDGNGGTIALRSRTIRLRNGAEISARSQSQGDAGTIHLRGQDIALSGRSIVSAAAIAGDSIGGQAGTIQVRAGQLTLTGGARIDSNTTVQQGPGSPETVDRVLVKVAGAIHIVGEGHNAAAEALSSGIFSTTAGSEPGGNLTLTARSIELRQGGSISAASTGTGKAGSIRLTASDTVVLSENSSVTTRAERAVGGTIKVTAQNLVRLRHSTISTSVNSGAGGAGDITIDPEFTILENSKLLTTANDGPGGNITIVGKFLRDPASVVDADSLGNSPGEINVQEPITNLSGIVAPLPQDFVPTTVLLSNQCAARLRAGTVSSLVARGRDGIPATPAGVLPGRLYQATTGTARPTTVPGPFQGATTGRDSAWRVDATGHWQVKNWTPVRESRPTWDIPCAPH
jgi:large exoprotein involved in heme utilization and adhesion